MKIPSKHPATFAVLLFLAAALSFSALAGSTNVVVGPNNGFTFSPAVVTIHTGDQVIWTWTNIFIPHSTTSGTVIGTNAVPSGLWDSGLHTVPFSFTNKFNSPGTFDYYCSRHYSRGMVGSVIVVSGSAPPSVALVRPADGAVFSAPANVTLQAAVTNGSAAVTNVQFLVGAAVLTNETVAPFSATTDNLAAGNYTLSAIAEDNAGVKATNSVSISVVTPVAVALTNSAVRADTNFQFSYLVNTGLSYVIQRSTNLAPADWISLLTNVAASNPAVFLDQHATNRAGFYRVGRLPNP